MEKLTTLEAEILMNGLHKEEQVMMDKYDQAQKCGIMIIFTKKQIASQYSSLRRKVQRLTRTEPKLTR